MIFARDWKWTGRTWALTCGQAPRLSGQPRRGARTRLMLVSRDNGEVAWLIRGGLCDWGKCMLFFMA